MRIEKKSISFLFRPVV
uniref:Uncharacterized protein n=1 Tax=Anguilla anguilla TaxID=7936 RepID=A0A0E9U673_ANGAN